jgi:DNA-directed RNA polymerase subunit beta
MLNVSLTTGYINRSKPPPGSYSPIDIDKLRNEIYNQVLEQFKSLKPVANELYTLSLEDIHYDTDGEFDLSDEKDAVMFGKTLYRRLRGRLVLKDNKTGQIVAQKDVVLAHVPYMTRRGGFIINGTEYALNNQLRLRPGIYHRISGAGEASAHVNITPDSGLAHQYIFDAENGRFLLRLSLGGGKVRNKELLPILEALGATKDEIIKYWGKDIYNANAKYSMNKQAILDALEYLEKSPSARNVTEQQPEKRLAAILMNMPLNKDIARITLGVDKDHIDKEVILRSTQKLLQIWRGEAEEDQRDNLSFQNVLTPAELISERVKHAVSDLREILFKATRNKNLDFVTGNLFTHHLLAPITDSSLGQVLDQTNLADNLQHMVRITKMGYGGIASPNQIEDKSRELQPSHLGYIDITYTSESELAGVDLRMAAGTVVHKGKPYTKYFDLKNNTYVWLSPEEVYDKKIVLPGEDTSLGKIRAIHRGKITYIEPHEADLLLPNFENAFNVVSNLIPLKSSSRGNRVSFSTKGLPQAVPLVQAEAPLVQPVDEDGISYYEKYAKYFGNVYAQGDGKVLEVTDKYIKVRYNDGSVVKHPLYNNFPLNRHTYVHNYSLVKPGDSVRANQLLARSNLTDDKGQIALGRNLKVGYIFWRGMNYEDAIVISESAAKKLASQHMMMYSTDYDDKSVTNPKYFASIFPSELTKDQLSKYDENGLPKPGTILQPGDPIMLKASPVEYSYRQLYRGKKRSIYRNDSLYWNHSEPGQVVEVAKDGNKAVVTISANFPLKVGDKLTGLYGDKGVVAAILPDDQMPVDENGEPLEILVGPTSIITRINPSQLIEAALGKIAKKTGKTFYVQDWDSKRSNAEWALQELKKHGLSDKETLYDPVTGKPVGKTTTGYRYFVKLHHMAEFKESGRGLGSYTSEGMPSRTKEEDEVVKESAKRLSWMDVNAMLGHGAFQVLRDAKLIRGQANQDYWRMFQAGFTPPTPQVPLVFDKFVSYMKGAGINIERSGNQLNMFALGNNQIKQLTGNRKLQNAETVDILKDLKPIRGGLFDQALTGGHNGIFWSYIELPEPVPNPIMVDAIRTMLGLTAEEFEKVYTGKQEYLGKTGPQAILDALKRFDNLDQSIRNVLVELKDAPASKKDRYVKTLKYLLAAKKSGVKPSEWMWERIPVIPPVFRPIHIIEGEKEIPLVSDANYLYRTVFDAANLLDRAKKILPDPSYEREVLYKSVMALAGLIDPIKPTEQSKQIKGLLEHVFGPQPKAGMVQSKLLSTEVDLVGRSVVVPDPNLSIDEVGLPEEAVWRMYKPFVVRRLRQMGYPMSVAIKMVEDRHMVARDVLLDELNNRPVLLNRYPILHRFGLMAFWPKIVPGEKVIHVNPNVTAVYAMDFDGDTSNFHIPVTEEARREAILKMLPSRNLFTTRDFQGTAFVPKNEYAGGLYSLTIAKPKSNKPVKKYKNPREVLAAYLSGELSSDDVVELETT